MIKLEDFKTLMVLAFCTKAGLFEFLEDEKSVEDWLDFRKMLSGQVKREEEFFKSRIMTLGKFSLLCDIKIVIKVAELEESVEL
ncbi:MAG: hypothetical protein QXN34_07625 [Archaeoglobaceae archaeon]